jgi:hypothetical protein|tara:strand:- start:943 stop:1410 length:468 start_codon:yes stop_codon:yes gene_type:complete
MSNLYQNLHTLLHQVGTFQFSDLRRYSAAEIRTTIQELMNEDRVDLAVALGEAGSSLYPRSEDMLSITSLLAATEQEWTLAIERLTELLEIQGANAQPFSYLMLTRCYRCDLDPSAALQTVRKGLEAYPDDVALQEQLDELRAYAEHAFAGVAAD